MYLCFGKTSDELCGPKLCMCEQSSRGGILTHKSTKLPSLRWTLSMTQDKWDFSLRQHGSQGDAWGGEESRWDIVQL